MHMSVCEIHMSAQTPKMRETCKFNIGSVKAEYFISLFCRTSDFGKFKKLCFSKIDIFCTVQTSTQCLVLLQANSFELPF